MDDEVEVEVRVGVKVRVGGVDVMAGLTWGSRWSWGWNGRSRSMR